MTKIEAVRSIATLSSGTIAVLIGNTSYRVIDETVNRWIETILEKTLPAMWEPCKNWRQVYEILVNLEKGVDR